MSISTLSSIKSYKTYIIRGYGSNEKCLLCKINSEKVVFLDPWEPICEKCLSDNFKKLTYNILHLKD